MTSRACLKNLWCTVELPAKINNIVVKAFFQTIANVQKRDKMANLMSEGAQHYH